MWKALSEKIAKLYREYTDAVHIAAGVILSQAIVAWWLGMTPWALMANVFGWGQETSVIGYLIAGLGYVLFVLFFPGLFILACGIGCASVIFLGMCVYRIHAGRWPIEEWNAKGQA